jgi:hypothetical protein
MSNGSTYRDEIEVNIQPGQALNLDIIAKRRQIVDTTSTVNVTFELVLENDERLPGYTVVLFNSAANKFTRIDFESGENVASQSGLNVGNYFILLERPQPG